MLLVPDDAVKAFFLPESATAFQQLVDLSAGAVWNLQRAKITDELAEPTSRAGYTQDRLVSLGLVAQMAGQDALEREERLEQWNVLLREILFAYSIGLRGPVGEGIGRGPTLDGDDDPDNSCEERNNPGRGFHIEAE